MSQRSIRKIHSAIRDDIADLVTRRALPTNSIEHLDPFLFLNHHGPQVYPPMNHGLPFGPHPHRGFETVTFILEGDLAHHDSGGHSSVIEAGGVQWMTAGRGLVHSEVSSSSFKEAGGKLEILQLWLNLPARLKMTNPAYVGLQADQIPSLEVADGKARMNLVSGEFENHTGAFRPLIDVHLMWIELMEGARLHLPVPQERNIFFYVISGELQVGKRQITQFQLAEFENDGDTIEVTVPVGRGPEKSRLLFGHAKPFDEPIIAHGPFVMNTREEILQAIRDYQAGKFE